MNGDPIESIIFHRPEWNRQSAYSWVMKHGYRPIEPPFKTPHYWRLRLDNPKKFKRFATIPFGENTGIQAVLGYTR